MQEKGKKYPPLPINNLSTILTPFVDKYPAKREKKRKFFCVSA